MTLSKYDRFDLEQAIMAAWGTCEDIDLIYHNTDNLDLNAEDCDNIQNQLLGLKSITELRFEKVWHIFEELIHHQKLEVADDDIVDFDDIEDSIIDDIDDEVYHPHPKDSAAKLDEEYMSMLNDIDNLKGMVK
jgi:hypothetical protein